MTVTIGEAARQLGLDTHVLRHWDATGAVSPLRTAAGHRRYTDDDIDRAQLVMLCQRVGLSLSDIARLSGANKNARREIVNAHLQRLHVQQSEIEAAIGFLGHTLTCSHPVVRDCPECAQATIRASRHRRIDTTGNR